MRDTTSDSETTSAETDRSRAETRESDPSATASTAGPGGTARSLQRAAGNQAVKDLYRRGELQARLDVSQSGDPAEREAERVANEVVDSGEPTTDTESSVDIRRSASGEGQTSVDGRTEARIDALRGGGSPLSRSVRSYFEPRFGRDFSDVRVHTGSEADAVARSIEAEAFTVGRDVAFASGNYRPETTAGRELLGHELTHVVQQRAAPSVQRRTSNETNSRPDWGIDLTGYYTDDRFTLQLNEVGNRVCGEIQLRRWGEHADHMVTERYYVEGYYSDQEVYEVTVLNSQNEHVGRAEIRPVSAGSSDGDREIVFEKGSWDRDDVDSQTVLEEEGDGPHTFSYQLDDSDLTETDTGFMMDPAVAYERTPLSAAERRRLDNLAGRVSEYLDRYEEGKESLAGLSEVSDDVVDVLSYWRDLDMIETPTGKTLFTHGTMPDVTSSNEQWQYVQPYLKRQLMRKTVGSGDNAMDHWSKLARLLHEYKNDYDDQQATRLAAMLDIRIVENFAIEDPSPNHHYEWKLVKTSGSVGSGVKFGAGAGMAIIRKKSGGTIEWTQAYAVGYGEVGATFGVSADIDPGGIKGTGWGEFTTHLDWNPEDFAGHFFKGKVKGPKIGAKILNEGVSASAGGASWFEFHGPAGETAVAPPGDTQVNAKKTVGAQLVSNSGGVGYLYEIPTADPGHVGTTVSDLTAASGAQVVRPGAYFAVDGSNIGERYKLDAFFAKYRTFFESAGSIRVVGHASYTYQGQGDLMEYNRKLSEDRAAAVSDRLTEMLALGVQPQTEGWGALLHKRRLLLDKLQDVFSQVEWPSVYTEEDVRTQISNLEELMDNIGMDTAVEQTEDQTYRRVDIALDGELAFKLEL
jgi:outer membrane protein OmpA-like peptidoglycan-associated protein